MTEKTKDELIEKLGTDIRNAVNNKKLTLVDVFKSAADIFTL